MRYALALIMMALAIFFQPSIDAAANLSERLHYAAVVAAPSLRKRLRYADLERLGVVNNRTTLGNWIRDLGFPAGQLTGPNTRTWGEDEVQAWLDTRPTEPKPRHRPSARAAARASTRCRYQPLSMR
jgi:predicted DNA-binding transcriptional regulator AlpA